MAYVHSLTSRKIAVKPLSKGYVMTDADRIGLATLARVGEVRDLPPMSHSREGSDRRNPLSRLTPRQMDVLTRVARGWSNRRIAEDLRVSVRTVESVVSDVFAALAIDGERDGYNARVSCVLVYLRHISNTRLG